jgi:hypothetical protein
MFALQYVIAGLGDEPDLPTDRYYAGGGGWTTDLRTATPARWESDLTQIRTYPTWEAATEARRELVDEFTRAAGYTARIVELFVLRVREADDTVHDELYATDDARIAAACAHHARGASCLGLVGAPRPLTPAERAANAEAEALFARFAE